jgi:hypothetical protein
VGIAVWGAILVGRGADKAAELTAGTPTTSGDRPRELVEAASSGNLDQALAAVAPQARQVVADAAGAGFLAGLNAVLILAALLSFAGAVLALWLVREHEIQRPPMAPERQPQSEAPTEAAGAGRAARSTGAARPAGSCPADITHVMNRPHMPGRPLVLPHEGEVGRQFPLRGRVHGPGREPASRQQRRKTAVRRAPIWIVLRGAQPSSRALRPRTNPISYGEDPSCARL